MVAVLHAILVNTMYLFSLVTIQWPEFNDLARPSHTEHYDPVLKERLDFIN